MRSLLAKINRAYKHIEELQVAHSAFFASNPYEVITEVNYNTGKCIYRVGDSVKPVPDEVVVICGDVLHNLRSSLDLMAWHLVLAANNKPTRDTSFPIANSPEEYASPQYRGKVKGMSQKAIDAIDALKPYKTGNDLLWRLHQLNRIDKHRLLLAAGAAHRAHSATPAQRKMLTGVLLSMGRAVPNPMRLMHEKPRILKAGDTLLTIPIKEMEENMEFGFDIVFDEPGIVEGKSVVETLHEMHQFVGNVAANGVWAWAK